MSLVMLVTPIRRVERRAAAVLALAALALACATPVTQEDIEKKLRKAGASVSRLGGDFLVVPIHADSKLAAWTLIAEAKSDGGTELGNRLSHDFRRAAKRHRGVVVGGPYSELTRVMILDAFVYVGSHPLTGLTLVYVGDVAHARELRMAAKSAHANFYHRDMP